ncbi:MAG: hypothetical protein WCT06_03810 [Armatimonadota bacterium]
MIQGGKYYRGHAVPGAGLLLAGAGHAGVLLLLVAVLRLVLLLTVLLRVTLLLAVLRLCTVRRCGHVGAGDVFCA